MLDHLWKPHMDRWWDALGRLVARTGLTANAVTWIAFALSAGNSALFLAHRSRLAYGIALAAVELLDDLDGAVARVTGTASRYGSYLDATSDRYKEMLSLLAVAAVSGYWEAGSLALGASLLVSYASARAAAEGAPGTRGFGPDMAERFERVAALCLGLSSSALLPEWRPFGHDPLLVALLAIALGSHVTAAQRFLRARRALREPRAREQSDSEPPRMLSA
jgi:phosphatidylglycerophosphate synthase